MKKKKGKRSGTSDFKQKILEKSLFLIMRRGTTREKEGRVEFG